MENKKIPTLVGSVIIIIMAVTAGLYIYHSEKNNWQEIDYTPDTQFSGAKRSKNLVCTQEAKQCLDGSYVGRDSQNNCEFAPCPGEMNTRINLLDPNDQDCSSDDDCALIPVECSCNCSVLPINKKFQDKYYKYRENKCQGNISMCDLYCEPPMIKCFKGKCAQLEKNIVGNDRDEHGCIGSAGYAWCEEKQKCLREWEEKCGR